MTNVVCLEFYLYSRLKESNVTKNIIKKHINFFLGG